MSVQTREILKAYFETGAKPTQAQFENLIDSLLHVNDQPVTYVTGKVDITNGDDASIDIAILNCASGTDYTVMIRAYEVGDETAGVYGGYATSRDDTQMDIYNNSGSDLTFEYIIQKI